MYQAITIGKVLVIFTSPSINIIIRNVFNPVNFLLNILTCNKTFGISNF